MSCLLLGLGEPTKIMIIRNSLVETTQVFAEHCNLFVQSVSDDENKFYNIDTWAEFHTTFYACNLLFRVISKILCP